MQKLYHFANHDKLCANKTGYKFWNNFHCCLADTKNEPEVKGEPCPVADIGSGDHADFQTSESPLTNGETKDATIEKNNVKTEKTPAKEELTANDYQKVEASENSQALS